MARRTCVISGALNYGLACCPYTTVQFFVIGFSSIGPESEYLSSFTASCTFA